MDASRIALDALAFALTYAIHSTLLLGVACLVGPRLLRSLALRERLWKVALFGGLATAAVQVGAGWRTPLFHWTLEPEGEVASAVAAPSFAVASAESAAVVEAADAGVAASLELPSAAEDSAQQLESAAPELAVAPGFAGQAPAPVVVRHVERAEPAASFRWRAWTSKGVFAWAGFAALVVAAFAAMWLRLERRLRHRRELTDGELRAALDRLLPLAFPAGRRVRLFVAPELAAPVSFGVARLSICVPPRALDELGADEQESMLAHELAHLARRDPLWLSAAWLVERVFFFQPLNRVARAELHDCAELLCDDWAAARTGNRLALASCLARIAQWVIGAPRALPATSMAESHGRCRLTQRIERLLEDGPGVETPRRWLAPAAAGALSCLVFVVPGVSAPFVRALEDGELRAAPADGRDGQLASGASAADVWAPPAAHGLEGELDALDGSVAALEQELARLRAEVCALAPDPELEAALGRLEQRAQRLDLRCAQVRRIVQLFAALGSDQDPAADGFPQVTTP